MTEPAAPDPEGTAPRPSTFSLEGRAVPAIYLIGWVGSVMGLAVILVSFMASGSSAAGWLFMGGLIVLAIGLVAAGGSQAIEGSRRADLAYRGPSPVLAFLAVFAITLIATVLVLAPLSAMGFDVASPAGTSISLLITMVAYIAIVRLLVVGTGALSWAEMGVHRPTTESVRDLAIGAVFAVPVLIVSLVLVAVLSRFLEPAPSPLPEAVDPGGLILNLISAAILAPIGEELFFRGFATTAWARAVGAGPAIIRGALFFAIAHVLALFDATFETGAQRALYSLIALLPVGLTLGWLFLARRSLYAAIGLHATFNAIQVLLVAAAVMSGR